MAPKSSKRKFKFAKNDKKFLNEAKEKVKKDGLDGISDWYIRQIKEWEKNKKVFAFIGSKKSGNFLIEALTPRNSDKDPEIKFKNLRLNSTSKKPKFRKLDAFLIIVKSRLKNERAIAIAKKILEKHRKPVIFIIAHTDEGKDKDRKESVKDLVKDESDIYVIDKEDKSKYDFNRLLGDIESKLLKRRKDLFLQCLNEAVFLNTRKNKERFKQAQEHSVDKILEFYSKNLISLWIDTEINFAITGNSGTGKSSSINAVRGIKASEKKAAAPVGIIEMRKKPTEYSHPNHKNIIFWDLPGIGTPTYPNLKEYCTKVGGLEKYDAFLIFCKSRFTQHDKELAEKVSKELDKPFFFICTNVDTELKNAKDDEGPKFDEASVMKRMRKNCLKNLEGLIHHEKDVFLIDNKVTEKYDFQRLKESIAKSLPEEKQESFVASLDKSTHAIIRIKANFLRAQVQLVIVLFVIAESNPEVFVELISMEVIRYHHVFGLYDQLKKSLMTSEEIDELCHKEEEHEKKIRRKIDEKIQKKKSEEIKEELMKDKSVEESPAKVKWAYEYLLNCIKSLEKEALKPYDAANKEGENSQT